MAAPAFVDPTRGRGSGGRATSGAEPLAAGRVHLPSIVRVMRRNFLSWRRFYRSSLVSALGEPLLLLLGLGYGLGRYVGSIEGLPYAQFIASGIVASSVMNVATFETTFSTFARMREQKTYDAIRATPVSLLEIMAGDLLWGACKCVITASAITLVMLVAGLLASPLAALLPLAGFLLGFPFGALGMCVSARARSWDSFTYYFTLGISVMFFFSGIFFPLASLPAPVRAIAWCLPLAHAVAITRALALGPLHGWLALHFAVLAAYWAVAFALAVRWMERRLVV
ncbi:MAG TPA: ABC transporter permease [Candidatus Binatia bacterium]|nr:ABC transporter permease [Candidatus Binatia bacterium]